MKVELLDYQPNALDLLIYTKNTRLRAEQTIDDIRDWSMDKKLEHLDYMKKTIQSSFEFVTYIFNIEGVSRAFTHQLVRTRDACYAQESQRTVDVRKSDVIGVGNIHSQYDFAAGAALGSYVRMIDDGIPVQDARGILPCNIETSITMGTHLRELMHMAEVRLCKRTQGEYQEVFKAMKAAVLEVHPYFEGMIEVACVKTGICIFPNYKECPVQPYTVIVSDYAKHMIKGVWEKCQHEAVPIAKDGKTM
jgi:thymidylate synthase ThyX